MGSRHAIAMICCYTLVFLVSEVAISLAASIYAGCVPTRPEQRATQPVALGHVAQATHEGNALAIFNR
jgi:hypothetical protein